jgi:hypothetical protein
MSPLSSRDSGAALEQILRRLGSTIEGRLLANRVLALEEEGDVYAQRGTRSSP